MPLPTLGQMLLATEGLALLRLAATDDVAAREARVAEMRTLLARDDDLARPLDTPEYDVAAGYGLWSHTYDAPLRLFPVEEPTVHALLGGLPPCRVLDAACGTGRHSAWLAARGHDIVGVDGSPEDAGQGAGQAAGRPGSSRATSRRCRCPTPRSMPPCAPWPWSTCPTCARPWPSSPASSGPAAAS